MKYIYLVEGMTCNGCRNLIEQKLQELFPEASIEVSLKESKVIIETSSKPSINTLRQQLPEKYILSEFTMNNDKIVSTNKISKWKQLKPLFLIFGYITVASILIHYKNWNLREAMLDFMGLFFIVFSFFKLLDLKGFPESFKMYDPLAKVFPLYAVIYPFIEIALGLALLLRFEITISIIVTIILLGITTFGVTKTLLNKKEIQCACLGTALKLPMTQATFIENSIMIVMGISMIL